MINMLIKAVDEMESNFDRMNYYLGGRPAEVRENKDMIDYHCGKYEAFREMAISIALSISI